MLRLWRRTLAEKQVSWNNFSFAIFAGDVAGFSRLSVA
jgi:hypothetical protein